MRLVDTKKLCIFSGLLGFNYFKLSPGFIITVGILGIAWFGGGN
jgi:hypothetical protein